MNLNTHTESGKTRVFVPLPEGSLLRCQGCLGTCEAKWRLTPVYNFRETKFELFCDVCKETLLKTDVMVIEPSQE